MFHDGGRPGVPMPDENTYAHRVRFPTNARADRGAAERALAILRDWRSGSAATAIVIGGLLPFAIAWHLTYLVAIAASMIAALTIAFACHLMRERRLSTLAAFPELAQLPDLARKRKRLQSARTRRTLAAGLRRTAAETQPGHRFDVCPVLTDRVGPLRAELLALAHELERTEAPDPASVALIHELLTSGTSPLYNRNLPAEDLYTSLARARTGIGDQSTA